MTQSHWSCCSFPTFSSNIMMDMMLCTTVTLDHYVFSNNTVTSVMLVALAVARDWNHSIDQMHVALYGMHEH